MKECQEDSANFEALIARLSSLLLNTPADQIDSELENSLRQVTSE